MPSAVRCMHESLSINKHVFKSPYLFFLSQFLLFCWGAHKLGYMVSKAQPRNPDTTRCQAASWYHFCVGSPVLWQATPEAQNGHDCLGQSATVPSGETGTLQNPPLGQLWGERQNSGQANTLWALGMLSQAAQSWAQVPVEVLWPGCAPSWGSEPLRAPVGWGNVTCHWQRVGSAARDQTAMAGVGLPIKGPFWGW